MKLSERHHLRFAANISFLWPEEPDPFERIASAARAGFTRIERTFVHDLDIARLRASLSEHQLELVLFDAYPGNWRAGERGLLAVSEREEDCRSSIVEAVQNASLLGTRLVNVLAGVVPADTPLEERIRIAAENLRLCAPVAEAAGVALVVEAINTTDVPNYAFPTVSSVLELVERVGHPAVGVQFDVYHASVMKSDVVSLLSESRTHVRHIQIADSPGRHEPGTGLVPFGEFFDAVGRFYSGMVGLEYHPKFTTAKSLEWLPFALRD